MRVGTPRVREGGRGCAHTNLCLRRGQWHLGYAHVILERNPRYSKTYVTYVGYEVGLIGVPRKSWPVGEVGETRHRCMAGLSYVMGLSIVCTFAASTAAPCENTDPACEDYLKVTCSCQLVIIAAECPHAAARRFVLCTTRWLDEGTLPKLLRHLLQVMNSFLDRIMDCF